MPIVRCLLWLLLIGFAAASLLGMARSGLSARVPHCAAETPRELTVGVLEVASSPSQDRSRLQVAVRRDHIPECVDLSGRRLRLNWHFPPPVQAGEVWRVEAKVRAPWGYQNPGGFDYERWLFGNGIDGVGYIRSGERLLPPLKDLRQRVREAVAERLADRRHGAHLRALATGDGSALTVADWALLRRTGTVHLLVVSGLHVGLVALLGYAVGAAAARLVPAGLVWLPAGWLAAAVSLAAMTGFVWLCGADPPALRAGVMSGLAALAFAGGRRAPVASWLALAAVMVICVDPGAVLTQGFWLSFGAVAVLVAGFANRMPALGWSASLFRAQVLMVLAMTVMTATVVGEVAPAAGFANLIAVPWISLVAVPLVMFSLVATLAGAPFDGLGWALADLAVSALLNGLEVLGNSQSYPLPVPLGQGLAALAAFACALGATHWRARLACLPLWAAGLMVFQDRPAEGQFEVLALDVGQGSAALIDTRNHRLLFDAGPRFPSGFDVGEAVVLPAIVATGKRGLDRLIVSHGDLDHAGGAAAVLRGAPAASVWGDAPELNAKPCRRGERWTWDGVAFAVLHPPAGYPRSGNDASCVLQVSAGDQRVLLTGDITRRVEATLVTSGLAPATLLFAPHHGSGSSSSKRFVEAVNPPLVFISAGWRNAYGHPQPQVVRRYRLLGSQVWMTGIEGALQWSSATPERVVAYRRERNAVWAWWVNRPPANYLEDL